MRADLTEGQTQMRSRAILQRRRSSCRSCCRSAGLALALTAALLAASTCAAAPQPLAANDSWSAQAGGRLLLGSTGSSGSSSPDSSGSGSPDASSGEPTAASPSSGSPGGGPTAAPSAAPVVQPPSEASPLPAPAPTPAPTAAAPAVAPSPAPTVAPTPAIAPAPLQAPTSTPFAAPVPAPLATPALPPPAAVPVAAPAPAPATSPSIAPAPAPQAASPQPQPPTATPTAAAPGVAPPLSAPPPPPSPSNSSTLGTALTLNGTGLLPWSGSARSTFETQYKDYVDGQLGSGADVNLTYIGSLGVNVNGSGGSNSTRRLRRSLLQSSGSDKLTIYYDIGNVPANEMQQLATDLANTADLQQLLTQNGLNLNSITLVTTQSGGITLGGSPAPAPSSKSSNNSEAGKIGGGITAGVVVLALIILVLFFVCRRKRQKADNYGSLNGAYSDNGAYSSNGAYSGNSNGTGLYRSVSSASALRQNGGARPVYVLPHKTGTLGGGSGGGGEDAYYPSDGASSPGSSRGGTRPVMAPRSMVGEAPAEDGRGAGVLQRIRDGIAGRNSGPQVQLGKPHSQSFDPYAPSLEEGRRRGL